MTDYRPARATGFLHFGYRCGYGHRHFTWWACWGCKLAHLPRRLGSWLGRELEQVKHA